MSLASDDATHFWEDKLQNQWQSSAEKMQQLTTSRRHQNNPHYFGERSFRSLFSVVYDFLSLNTFRDEVTTILQIIIRFINKNFKEDSLYYKPLAFQTTPFVSFLVPY